MTDWLARTIARIEKQLDAAIASTEDKIEEILKDLAKRATVHALHHHRLGRLENSTTSLEKRLATMENKVARIHGKIEAAESATASMPWWRDWWAVLIMALTVIPVTLAMALALGLLTPDQASQAAKAAVEGLFKSLGLRD
jgi:hypothetical protein